MASSTDTPYETANIGSEPEITVDPQTEIGRLKDDIRKKDQKIAELEARLQVESREVERWMNISKEQAFATHSALDAVKDLQEMIDKSTKQMHQTDEASTPQASYSPGNTRAESGNRSRGRAAPRAGRGSQRGRGSTPQGRVTRVTNTRPGGPVTPKFTMPVGPIEASGYHLRLVERQVVLLLETLIAKPDKFDEISEQVIAWANTSERERDGRTMIIAIRAIFTTLSTGDTPRSEVYGRLCRKLMDGVSLKVRDDELVDTNGKPVSGPQIFRKYLIRRCQQDFEKYLDSKSEGEGTPSDSEEVRPSTHKQAVSLPILCGFMGELFKQGVLTERVMHECLKALLGNIEDPGEEQLEVLCSLLNSIGAKLDTPATRAHMDIYFRRVETFSTHPQVELPMRGKLKEIIQLRERKWDGKQMARLRLSRR